MFNHPADFQMSFNSVSNGVLDAEKGMRDFATESVPPRGSNYSLYSNPRYDELLDKAVATLEPAERAPLYAQAIQLVWNDAPVIFLYIQPTFHAKSKRVNDVAIRANETLDVSHAWIAP